MKNRKPLKVKSIKELADISKKDCFRIERDSDYFNFERMEYLYLADSEEIEYIKTLSPKELLAYRQARENEEFLNNI